MDPRQLRHLLALHEEGSFVKAAERVHLTQSALSRSIQTLERQLELRLFERLPQGVRATPAGRELVERARPLLRQLNGLAHEMRGLRGGLAGRLRLGAGPFPAASLLAAPLAELARNAPALRVDLLQAHAPALLAQLKAEALECFVADMRELGQDRELQILPLLDQEAGLFCRIEHPLLRAERLDWAALAAYRFAGVQLPAGLQAGLRQALALLPAEPLPLALQCDQIELLLQVTRESNLLLLATRAAVQPALDTGSLAELDLVGRLPGYRAPQARIGLVSLRGRSLSPAATWLAKRLAAPATQSSPSAPG